MLWALAVVRYYCGSRFPPLSKADVPMIVVLALADPLGSAGCLVVAACLRAARRLAADGLLLTELALKCYRFCSRVTVVVLAASLVFAASEEFEALLGTFGLPR